LQYVPIKGQRALDAGNLRPISKEVSGPLAYVKPKEKKYRKRKKQMPASVSLYQ